MKYGYYIALIISILICFKVQAQTTAEDVVFKIEVQTDVTNNTINLNWNKLPNVFSYRILRKKLSDPGFVLLSTQLFGDTTFVDSTVLPNETYEYAVYAGQTNNISGYVLAGYNIEAKHSTGNILLVVDSTYIIPAHLEIELFKKDLIKEGWKVFITYAGRQETPAIVKQRIINCHATSNLEGVILLGHIPVPYSGNIAPDAHNDHVGAWPSDVFYADMTPIVNSIWNDVVVINTTASSGRNHQLIGDGKFDVSSIGNTTMDKIFVGRIDVSNMSFINSDDIALFKQYINKNHAYRASIKKFRMRGLVDDNFGYYYGEAFAQNGWRNMSSLLGRDSVTAGDYMTDLKNDSYLWSYACGGGWHHGATGVGITNDFQSNQLESVFTMLYGSYFGDWDVPNNFLRGPIASPSSTLVSFWAGRPNWFMHNMALGEPIGYSYLKTIDNTGTYFPKGYANAQVHLSIQGDPSLRMYMFEAPTELEAFLIDNNSKVKLEWNSSVDPNVTGYYIYRATNINGDFQLLNQIPITNLEYVDTNPLPISQSANTTAYMVRAVKLEQAVTGSFYNLSPGEISEGYSVNSPLPVQVVSFEGYKNTNSSNSLIWAIANEENIIRYEIERSYDQTNYQVIGRLEAIAANNENWDYSLTDYNPYKTNYYRLRIVDVNERISYHNKIVLLKKSVDFGGDILFPNPATKEINLSLSADYDGQLVQLAIYDVNGRVVYSRNAEIGIQNALINITIDKLTIGNYFLRYKKEEELNIKSFQFVKTE